jgi:sterol desaturase/sphingolipid hydroxylase (fatty acid hydroxylase superfamily)
MSLAQHHSPVPPPPPPFRPVPVPPAPYRNPAAVADPPNRATDPETTTTGGTALALVATGLLVALALVVRATAVFGLVVVAAIFIPLERLASLHPQKVLRPLWKTDVVHLLVNNILATVGVLAVVVGPAVALRLGLGSTVTGAVGAQPLWLQFTEAVLLTELVGYWAHRASHQVPWLWRFHAVHHSISEMDWLAAGRLHPVDQVFTRACVVLPLIALGFSRQTFGAYLAATTLWAIFIHANVRWTFGPLRWVVATPAYHHWHHTNDAGAVNHNFAGQLPLLDVVFGTCHLPEHEWPATYGIDPPVPETYLGQLAWSFRDVAH